MMDFATRLIATNTTSLKLLTLFWCLDTSKTCWTEGLPLLTLEQVQLSKIETMLLESSNGSVY